MSIYLAAMGFGLVLLVSTIFLGDSDLDADTDLDMDPTIDFDAEVDFTVDGAGELDALNTAEKKSKVRFIPFLSIRFWTFGLTIFGVTGFILVKMDQSTAVHVSLAVAMGLLVGWAAALIFHQLKRTPVDSSPHADPVAGRRGAGRGRADGQDKLGTGALGGAGGQHTPPCRITTDLRALLSCC